MEINPRLSSSRGMSASRTVSRSFHATRLMLKKQLWIWPLVAAVVLLLAAYGLRRAVDDALSESIAGQLQAILSADATVWRSRRAQATLSATTAESTSTPTTDHTAVWTAT